jgi:hypothetical protein
MPELLEHPRTPDGAPALPEGLRPAAVPERVSDETRRRARGDLRVQIAALERELAELFAAAFPRRGISYAVPAAGGPRVLGVAELERVRDALAARVQEVRGWLTDRGYVEERNREFLERLITQPESFPWVRVSNEDIGEPGCRHWHSRPRWGLLGMIMGWWRVKLSSGCPLATGRGAAAAPLGTRAWRRSASAAGARPRRVPSRLRRRAAAARRPPSRRGGRARPTDPRPRPGGHFRLSRSSSSSASSC